ncbi:MAG: LLM class flavin-dependent oxidoreductase [Vicinamibacterales bacterium]
MTRPLRVGLQLPEAERRVPFDEVLVLARRAEAVGFDALWLGDHLLYELADGVRGPHEVWTSLAALAAVTERVTLGPLVACTAFHAPALLAKQAATVDAIAGGRLVLGLGAGWHEPEFRAFGLPFDHRVGRFEEAFTIIRRLLAGEEVSFAGRWHRVERCLLEPPPVRAATGGPPLLVGSVGPRMLAIALPHVAAWNAWWTDFGNDVDGFTALKARMDAAVASAGRAAGSVRATVALWVRLEGATGRPFGDEAFAHVAPLDGMPARLAEQLRAFAAAGADEVMLVADPITGASVERLGEALALLS